LFSIEVGSIFSEEVFLVTNETGRFFGIFDLEAAESDFLRCDKDFFMVENEDIDKVLVLVVIVGDELKLLKLFVVTILLFKEDVEDELKLFVVTILLFKEDVEDELKLLVVTILLLSKEEAAET